MNHCAILKKIGNQSGWVAALFGSIVALIPWILPLDAFAQSTDNDQLLESQPGWSVLYVQQLSSSEIPFWFAANRGGMFADASTVNSQLQVRYLTKLEPIFRGISMRTGFLGTALHSDADPVIRVHNLFAHVEGYRFRLSIGRYDEVVGHGAPHLSTGKMMLSRNAVPTWKISFQTPDFVDVPYLRGYVAFKGRWSEEWTTDERYVDGAMVHRKFGYINVRPIPQLNLIGGIVHNVMYGGTHPVLGVTHTFETYVKDIFGFQYENSKTPLGNGVAAYDFSAEYHAGDWTLAASKIMYLEDRVSANIRSAWDGLWSGWFELHKKNRPVLVDYIMYEHLNTRRQDAMDFDLRGRAKYGAHRHWRSGYTHHSRFFGSSLFGFTPMVVTETTSPITNNIIVAHHAGIKGDLSETVRWAAMATYSRNYGICSDQLPESISRTTCYHINYDGINMREMEGIIPPRDLRKDRYSVYVAVSKRWQWSHLTISPISDEAYPQSFTLKVAFASDWGEFYEETRYGVEITAQIQY